MRIESVAPVRFAVVAVKLTTGPAAGGGVCAQSREDARAIPKTLKAGMSEVYQSSGLRRGETIENALRA